MHKNAIRVLVVDDSALVREILVNGLSQNDGITAVGAASDPYLARDMILKHRPDVLTLDVEMPRMNGLQFLKRLMSQYPLPVIMVSALTYAGSKTTLEALEYGAVDFVLKPSANVRDGLTAMIKMLREKVKMAAKVDVSANAVPMMREAPLAPRDAPVNRPSDKVIAIGASTGGTEALRRVITALPPDLPGIVAVQHMPEGFTKMFAQHLNTLTPWRVKEAQSGDRVLSGNVLIAPGNLHTQLIRSGNDYHVICRQGDAVCGHRPSVDVLFRSVARHAGRKALAVMLTGMGDDGADAMVKIRRGGGRTVAQDEATSVVFGMPNEAFKRGGAEQLTPIDQIPAVIIQYLKEKTIAKH